MPFVLIRFGGEEVYGKFAFILNTLSTIIAIFSSGISNVVSRYLSNKDEKIETATFDELLVKSMRLILFVVASSVLFFAFGNLWFPEFAYIKVELFLGVLYILFTLLGNFIIGYHYAKQNYIKLSIAIFSSSLLQLFLLIPAAKFYGLQGVVIVYIAYSLVQLWLLLNDEIQFSLGALKDSFARFSQKMNGDQSLFLKFVLPIILASVAVPVSLWYANHQVALVFGFSDLGFINIALQMQVIMAFLPTIFNSMAIPILSKTFKTGRKEFAQYFKSLAFKTIASSGVIFIIIFIFAKQILLFYSPNYVAYSDILRIFSISFFLSVILNIIGVVILSVASMWWGTILNVIWALSYVAGIVYYVPVYGLIGFAYSYLFSYSIHLFSVLIYTFYFFRKNT